MSEDIKNKGEGDLKYDVYPLTIISDRFSGSISDKGKFIAFQLEEFNIPENLNGGGNYSWHFWETESENYIMGFGDTPELAYRDLCRELSFLYI